MHLEPAQPADLPALHDLVESAYRGDSAKLGWTHEADLLGGQRTDMNALEAMLTDPAQAILILRDGNEIDACAALADRGGGLTYLGMFTVAPALQATGIGRLLLAATEEHAAAMFGATRVEMTVIAQRLELVAWYERRGYHLTGERRPFPANNPRFGLPKRDDLEFVVLEKLF
jgi:ribosomal protein S18 acetylase RimI-like enzyme